MSERLACPTVCNSDQGCEALEQFDIVNVRDPFKYISVTSRCQDYNQAGGADGQQPEGTVCFLRDVQGMELEAGEVAHA